MMCRRATFWLIHILIYANMPFESFFFGYTLRTNIMANAAPAISTNSTKSVPDCCPPITLSPYTLDDSGASCTSTCSKGISAIGLDCNDDTPTSGKWASVNNFFSQLTSIEGDVILTGLRSCSFHFEDVQSIKASVVRVEVITDGPANFFKSLATVVPTNEDCTISSSIKDLPKSVQKTIGIFKNALEKGRQACLAARTTTTPPKGLPNPSNPIGSNPQHGPSGSSKSVSGTSNNTAQSNNDGFSLVSLLITAVVSFAVPFLLNAFIILFVWIFNKKQIRRLRISVSEFSQRTLDRKECIESLKLEHKATKEQTEEEEQYKGVKNRYDKVLCVKATRVHLEALGDSNFINANYVGVPGNKKRFIATQGPKSNTVVDFWCMTSQEKSENIIMVTDATELDVDRREGIKNQITDLSKCYDYYPVTVNQTLSFSENITIDKKTEKKRKVDVSVTCVKSGMFIKTDKTQIRRTVLDVDVEGKVHRLTIWQWLQWPDHGAPEHVDESLIKLLNETMKSKYPVIVHCSAGIGRTGTVIMVAFMLHELRAGRKVDGRETLVAIRRDRSRLVQDYSQYLFAHQVILVYYRDYCGLDGLEDKHDEFTKKYEEAVKISMEYNKLHDQELKEGNIAELEAKRKEDQKKRAIEKKKKQKKQKAGGSEGNVVEAGVAPQAAPPGPDAGAAPEAVSAGPANEVAPQAAPPGPDAGAAPQAVPSGPATGPQVGAAIPQ